MDRKFGILLPVSALPSDNGIGCFSKEAYDFVDYLSMMGASYWQILPLGQTGYGDSPYQSCSTFAGNPYFIDLGRLVENGFIRNEDLPYHHMGGEISYVDYGDIYEKRYPLLKKAYENSPYAEHVKGHWCDWSYDEQRAGFEKFREENQEWLSDYSRFMAIKDFYNGKAFCEWDEGVRKRWEEPLNDITFRLTNDIRFYEFLQYMFHVHYMDLKRYANEKGIKIIGDLPIYVAYDSADTWSHPELFWLDGEGNPTEVAGCPPDAFTADGQLWGNPLYDWEYHRNTGYDWWVKRLGKAFEWYDVVRIDHFRGFEAFYAVPGNEKTARLGRWVTGPGIDFFNVMKQRLGDREIIAEDLGFLTDGVRKLLSDSGYPGMKVLEFAFYPGDKSDYLPHRYPENTVAYTGTHDNETLLGWYENAQEDVREYASRYTGISDERHTNWDFIRLLFQSKANTVIIPLQDFLELDNEARFNTPSTMGGLNWRWRVNSQDMTEKLSGKIRDMADLYERL